MSSNTLSFRAPARRRASVVMRVPAEQPLQALSTPGEARSRRAALHEIADHASPSVRGDFRIFALGNR